jgi:acyl-CoA thioester hydrolase
MRKASPDTPAPRAPGVFALPFRVYYEDTDAGGIVYHANYLRWMERVRTEWLRTLGVQQTEVAAQQGLQFVVSALEIRYLKPARLDDLLTVDLTVDQVRHASLRLGQRVWPTSPDAQDRVDASARPLVEASVRVAVMNRQDGRPAALPRWLLNAMESS